MTGYLAYISDGFKSFILNEKQISLIESTVQSYLPKCSQRVQKCMQLLETSVGRDIVLLGDSGAYTLAVGLQKISEDLE
jgi:hypothetical protein